MMAILQFEDMFGPYECAVFGKILERYNQILVTNKSFLILGKRRVREDDSFSLYIDRIVPMPEDEVQAQSLRQDPFFRTCLNESRMSSNTMPVVQVASETLKPSLSPFVLPASEEHYVAIRFTGAVGDDSYRRLMNLLAYFHGNCTVKLFLPGSNQLRNVNPQCFIDDDPDILSQIAKMCGEDNISVN